MIASQQAHDALRDAETAERRSAVSYSYSRSAPFLILWGLIWIAGYSGMTVLRGPNAGWLWLMLSAIGIAISIWIGNSYAKDRGRAGWRTGFVFVIIFAFTFALFSVLPPTNTLQAGAYSPLLLSAIYATAGLWKGIRFILLGAFLAIATLFAFFYLKDFFFVWMALAGGGSLLLTGLWMRHG
ncbi:MAG TPA: hypothetical protein VMU31_08210 [Rhizomicrobium sp.]|nr:hypothetical protein [Rhizomicrobium sp.]